MGEMTDAEKKYFDERFNSFEKIIEGLRKFFESKILDIQKAVQMHMVDTTNNFVQHREEIDKLRDKVNTNEIAITDLKGQVYTINEVKKAENKTKETGIKMWQFWLAFSIPVVTSTVSIILTILNMK